MKSKYITCFDAEKSEELQSAGFEFLYERGGVYYHKYNDKINFSNSGILENTKFSQTINF